jgi:hypothetical protein
MTKRRKTHAGKPRERGIVLALALFTMATLALVLASSLLVGMSDIRATRNYRGASQVHFVAESGLSHALQVANKANGIGVVDYQDDVANQWSGLFGTGAKTFAPLGGFTYTVLALVDNTNPTQAGWFRSTANGPEGAQNVVVANIVRTNIPSTAPGAVYLATDQNTNARFNGDSFLIDGNDNNYTTGTAGPGAPVPGISTRNGNNTAEAIGSLQISPTDQRDNVTGLGYIAGNPPTPSVMTSPAAPSVSQVNNIVQSILDNAGGNLVTSGDSTINNSSSICSQGWNCGGSGQTEVPKITHITGDVTFKANGSIAGEGIMIVDGNLSIQGTLDFKGLIIVRGQTQVGTTDVQGNANIWGSIWTDDINLVVAGNAFVKYSTQALALANQVTAPGSLPSPMKITALVDCAQAPAAPGCP